MESKHRTRSSNACEFCRVRKTRCDGQKPCFACSSRNIDCIYQKPKPTKLEQNVTEILNFVKEISSKLDVMTNKGMTLLESPVSLENSWNYDDFEMERLPNLEDMLKSVDIPLNNAFLIDNEPIELWGNGIDLENETKIVKSFKVDIGEDFSLDKLTYNTLKSAYLENIYSDLPIVCYDKISICEEAVWKNNHFTLSNSSDCAILLLICSLGSLVSNQADLGFQYFEKALEIKYKLQEFQSLAVHFPVLSTLVSFYYLRTFNLVLFWEHLQRSNKFLNMIIRKKYLPRKVVDDDFIDVCKRLFWVNLHFERNFLKLYRNNESNLFKFQKEIGLPSSCLPIPNLISEEKTYQSFCFMSNLLLENIDKRNNELLYSKESHDVEVLSKLTNKLKDDLLIWSESLPIKLAWNCNDDDERMIIILKVNLFKVLHSIDFALLERANILLNEYSSLVPQLSLVSHSLTKTTTNLLNLFNKLELFDQSPFLSFDVLDVIYKTIVVSNKFKIIPLNFKNKDNTKLIKEVINSLKVNSGNSNILKIRLECIEGVINEQI